MLLSVENISSGYGTREIIKDISLDLSEGEVLYILGPNGVGKTTLFKTLLGLNSKWSGHIMVRNREIDSYTEKELARIIAYIPQAHNAPFPFDVFDVVLMGRAAYLKGFHMPSKEDKKIAMKALEQLKIGHLSNKIYTHLSGGEKQLVLIARALAQKPQLLIMDEPTSNLDYGNQMLIIRHIKNLAKSMAVIVTSHFPNHAFLSATKVAILREGRIVEIGSPNEILTEKIIYETYGARTKVIESGSDGDMNRYCLPLLN